METARRQDLPAGSSRHASATVVLLVGFAMGCAAIAGLSAAGEDLQDAGYEVHDLLMEEEGSVHADLERPDGATDAEHFEQAAAIIWDHLDEQAQQVEIRLRSPQDTDEIVIYSVAELQDLHQERSD